MSDHVRKHHETKHCKQREKEGGTQLDSESAKKTTSQRKASVNTPNHKKRWDNMFNRLLEFKRQHNHCRVPNRYEEDPQLGYWVSTQRRQYRTLMFGEGSGSTPLAPDRVAQLNQIGFDWTAQDPRKKPWETRFEELRSFVKKYGHSQVPIGWKENPRLATWVSTQRQEFRLRKQGRSSRLTDSKIEMLNEIGFIWEAQRGRQRTLHERKAVSFGTRRQSHAAPENKSHDRDPSGSSPESSPAFVSGTNNEKATIERNIESADSKQQALTAVSFQETLKQILALSSSNSSNSRKGDNHDGKSLKEKYYEGYLKTLALQGLQLQSPRVGYNSSLSSHPHLMNGTLFELPHHHRGSAEQVLLQRLDSVDISRGNLGGYLRGNLTPLQQSQLSHSSTNAFQNKLRSSRLLKSYLAVQQKNTRAALLMNAMRGIDPRPF